ncbi:hypothetical protein [Hyphobacterium marinum]|uniref:FlgO domain-containing protein n=1 Tax=Hyphobacterium marinum TaxID=3116574 RepID=A0ABU7M1E4_9PROT|nr:hypothetical protein [Hyphobacterium sp. Y6023]MEE2567220.1 hypothetical protein [Hyphobacterium sp. Y6023]
MGNFLQELQRRSVFRVAAAYLVVGWLITQAVATIEGPLHLPPWTDTLVIVLLLCGLPVALILAWAFEVTPEGVKRTVTAENRANDAGASHVLDYAILGVLIVVAGLIGWQQFSGGAPSAGETPVNQVAESESGEGEDGELVSVVTPAGGNAQGAPDTDPRTDPGVSTATELSVAVLPFTAFSADAEDGYFADGLTEEILNSLAGIPELLVTSRTSAFQFRGDNVPSVPEIARSLGVAHILEGSVRRAGDRIRVTAQLIRASDDRHLWSQTYDRTMDDVFAIQEDIAENVAAVLQVVLDDRQRARMTNSGTRNIDAFIAYQQGAELWAQGHENGEDIDLIEQSSVHFERATQLAPDFSEAYLLQSDYYAHRLTDMARLPEGEFDRADFDQLNARRAELVADAVRTADSPARQAMAEANEILFADSWANGRQIVAEAFATDECANDNWLQFLIGLSGDLDGRLAYAQRQVRCDPLNGQSQLLLGDTYLARGDYQDALDHAARLDERGMSYDAEVIRFDALLGLGRFDEAEAMLGEGWDWEQIRLAARRGGPEASAVLDPYKGEDTWFDLMLHALLGEREAANAIAAQLDARPLGVMTLMEVVMACRCGAPFDLSATPNFAARLSEAGFPWPPAGDLGFPLMAD